MVGEEFVEKIFSKPSHVLSFRPWLLVSLSKTGHERRLAVGAGSDRHLEKNQKSGKSDVIFLTLCKEIEENRRHQ